MSNEEEIGMKNLVIFLARYVTDTFELRNKIIIKKDITKDEILDELIMRFPIIQGLSNQIKIKKISDNVLDNTKVKDGVEYMLKIIN
jgi:hypothetical protein